MHSELMRLALIKKRNSGCLRKQVGAVLVPDVLDDEENKKFTENFISGVYKEIILQACNTTPYGVKNCKEVGECLIIEREGRSGCMRCTHAEINAIGKAASWINPLSLFQSWNTRDAVIYVTLKPCLSCAQALVAARIKKVYYFDEVNEAIPAEANHLLESLEMIPVTQEELDAA